MKKKNLKIITKMVLLGIFFSKRDIQNPIKSFLKNVRSIVSTDSKKTKHSTTLTYRLTKVAQLIFFIFQIKDYIHINSITSKPIKIN